MKKGIGYKGHIISKKDHVVNAYIHFEYTVTGPLFEEPFKAYNLSKAKKEIATRAQAHPEWYASYLKYRRERRSVYNTKEKDCL